MTAISRIQHLHGRKGGKSGGGSSRSPIEEPNSLRSRSLVRFVDVISEGMIRGLVNGLKSIYLDDTPLQNEDGTFNFAGVTIYTRDGSPTQDYIPGFSDAETEKPLNVKVTTAIPSTFAINDDTVNAVRVKVRVPSLVVVDNTTGDQRGTSVKLAFDVKTDTGSFVEVAQMTITGKTTSPYERMIRLELPAGGDPWTVRVRRITADSGSSLLSNDTYVSTYTEVVDAKLNYPDSAIVAGAVDAQLFGSSVPTRKYNFYGIESEIPSNYDPIARTYTGIWDGTFTVAYHNNPAWVLWALMTNTRFGCGDILKEATVDKFGLYVISQYCDELIPNGQGGFEPRYTFNGIINSQDDAAKVLDAISTVFRGMIYWGAGAVALTMDSPGDVKKIVTPANIVGDFDYMGAAQKSRSSIIQVAYSDPALLGGTNFVVVQRDDLIRKFGERRKTVSAIGCNSRSQATRVGEWLLDTEEHETEVVTYTASLDNADLRPGDLIAVSDPDYMGIRYGGRVLGTAGAVTNLLYNSLMAGAVPGALVAGGAYPTYWSEPASASLTRTVVGLGSEQVNGTTLNYIDIRLQGTPSSTGYFLYFGEVSHIPVTEGEVYNNQFWYKLIAGSMTNITAFNNRFVQYDATQTQVATNTNVQTAPSSAWRKSAATRTVSNTTPDTAYMRSGISLTLTVGAAIDITVRIANPQMELGSTASEYFVGTITGAATTYPAITIDDPVDIEAYENYQATLTLPTGEIVTRHLVNAPGPNQNILFWSDPLPVAPLKGSLWALSSSFATPRKFRVISNTEKEENLYLIVALFHDPTKYDRIERDRVLPEPAYSALPTGRIETPTGLTAVEFFTISQESAVALSWQPASDARTTGFEVQYKDGDDTDWSRAISTTTPSVDIGPTTPGIYQFRVRGVGLFSPSSEWAELSVYIYGQNQPISQVQDFKISVNGPVTTLSWTALNNPNLAGYTVRYNTELTDATFEGSQIIAAALSPSTTVVTVPTRTGSYFIKGFSLAGTCATDAALVTCEIAGVEGLNVVATVTESPTFAGSHSGTVVNGSNQLRINGTGGGLATYTFANTLNLGAVYSVGMSASVKSSILNLDNTLNTWTTLADVPTMAGEFFGSWYVKLFMRTTQTDPTGSPTWSAWEEFTAATQTFWGAQFKLELYTSLPDSTPLVDILAVTADVADRISGAPNVSCPSGGLTVIFAQPFMATPTVHIDGQGLNTGDYHRVTSKSATGFTVQFFNSAGTGVARTFDWVAKGYGYRQ